MMNLAELHLMTGGPLDELVDAVEEVVADLDRKIEKSHHEYQLRTDEHNREVSRINSEISTANEDIAHTTEFLQNVLYV
jgi:peptidoglycan hydrolase CwlO-like protein